MQQPLKEILFPFQAEDSLFLSKKQRAIIGSEMGTGKTEIFLQVCEETNAKRVLVICPKTLVLEWKARIALRLGEDASVPKGLETGQNKFRLDLELFRTRFLVINYEMLRKESYRNILKVVPWDIIGFDEAHRLKNPKAKQSIGAYDLTEESQRIYLLTGTPFLNYPNELWSLLHLLFPQEYRDYWSFTKEYCVTMPSPWGPHIVGVKKETLPELRRTLEKFMVRREKIDVLKDLPPKSYRSIPVQLGPGQRKAYMSMEEELVVELESGTNLFAPSTLAKITRLRQLSLEPAMIAVPTASAKTEALLSVLDDVLEQGRKVVIYSTFKKFIYLIDELLVKVGHVVIHGDVSAEDRLARRIAFQNDPEIKVMLMTIEVAIGIDLTAADICIFANLFWTPAINRQAEDRLHRIGQLGNVEIIELYAEDTIDDDLHKIHRRKDVAFSHTISIQRTIQSMMARHGRRLPSIEEAKWEAQEDVGVA